MAAATAQQCGMCLLRRKKKPVFSGFYYLKTGPVFIRFLFQPNKNRGASAASYGYLACLRVHAHVHTGLSTWRTQGGLIKKSAVPAARYTRGTAPAEVPALQKLGWRPPVFGLSYSPWWSKPQAVAVWQRSAVGQWVVHWPIRRAGAKQCRASAPRGSSGFYPFFSGFYPIKKPSPVFTFFSLFPPAFSS